MLSPRIAIFLTLTVGGSAQTDGLSYRRVSVAGAAPLARLDGAMIHDAPGRRLVLFGGQASTARNDLWTFSLERQEWTEISPSGPPPSPRFGHTAVFDSARRRLIVFGGQGGGFFSDTWAYDLAQNTWQMLSPDSAGPSRRYGHSAIYDAARDRMVVSHGFTDAGRFDDTWAFHFATSRWENISPAGNRPLRRCLHHAAYDPRNNQMFLFGGCASGAGPCPLDDLWSFDLGSHQWAQHTGTPKPLPRQWYGTTFDAARNRFLIFGGAGPSGNLSDTWDYDPAGQVWRQLAPGGEAPIPRARHEGAFVADFGASFFFGGVTDTGPTNDLWMLSANSLPPTPAPGPGPSPGPRPQIASGGILNGLSFQGGPLTPGQLVSIFGTNLGPTSGVSATVDPATGLLPTRLSRVSVRFTLTSAPIYYARADQLNVQVPYELAGQTEALVTVTYAGAAGEAYRVPLAAVSPGLYPRAFNQDSTLNSTDNPAAIGSIIVLFGTGQGVTSPPSQTGRLASGVFPSPAAPVALRIGGRPAELLFQGQAPGTAGVIQVNARVPDGIQAGPAVPIVLTIGATESQQGVTIAVR